MKLPIKSGVKVQLQQYYVLPIMLYSMLAIIVYWILYAAHIVTTIPSHASLLKWDATFYASIKDNNYTFVPQSICNAGFLPLFAYWWKATGLNALGISILNGAVYIISLCWLCKTLKPDIVQLGLFMSLPFMCFMFTPLSESLFFLFGVMIIYGLKYNKSAYIFTGILLASLTRATALFILPSAIGMSLLLLPVASSVKNINWREILWIYVAPVLLGVVLVGFIQFVQTGNFFAYYQTQSEAWGRKFGLPVLPMGRTTELWTTRLSYFNFWIGCFMIAAGLAFLVKWLRRNPLAIPNYMLLAIIYLCMSFLSVIFFNPEWFYDQKVGYNTTYLNGINRYIQATPFTMVLVIWIFSLPKLKPGYFIPLLISTYLAWLCVYPVFYKHIQFTLEMSVVTGILLAYWLFHYVRWKPLGLVIIAWSYVLQSLMLNNFMSGIMVD